MTKNATHIYHDNEELKMLDILNTDCRLRSTYIHNNYIYCNLSIPTSTAECNHLYLNFIAQQFLITLNLFYTHNWPVTMHWQRAMYKVHVDALL